MDAATQTLLKGLTALQHWVSVIENAWMIVGGRPCPPPLKEDKKYPESAYAPTLQEHYLLTVLIMHLRLLFVGGGGEFPFPCDVWAAKDASGEKDKTFFWKLSYRPRDDKTFFPVSADGQDTPQARGLWGRFFPVIIYMESLSDSAWQASEDFSVLLGPWNEAALLQGHQNIKHTK